VFEVSNSSRNIKTRNWEEALVAAGISDEQLNRDKSSLDIFWLTEEPRTIGDKMLNSRVKIVFFLVFLGYLLSACATIKEAGRTIGHTTRDVTRAIGHGTRDAAKAVGEGVKKAVKSAPEDEW
jgi:predicted small secreted protein